MKNLLIQKNVQIKNIVKLYVSKNLFYIFWYTDIFLKTLEYTNFEKLNFS